MADQRIDDILRDRIGGGPRSQQAPAAAQGRRQRGPAMDTGTVALGLTAMSYYWLMPALLSRRKRRKKKSAAPDRPTQG